MLAKLEEVVMLLHGRVPNLLEVSKKGFNRLTERKHNQELSNTAVLKSMLICALSPNRTVIYMLIILDSDGFQYLLPIR